MSRPTSPAAIRSISGGQIPRSLLHLLGAVLVARRSEYLHQSHTVSVLLAHLGCPAPERRVVWDARGATVLQEVGLARAQREASLLYIFCYLLLEPHHMIA